MKALEPLADPFLEVRAPRYRFQASVLGASFQFESDSRDLLALARSACDGLPVHRMPGPAGRFVVRLILGDGARGRRPAGEPAAVRPVGATGLVGAVVGGSSFVAVDAAARSAIVVVARDLLRFPYHVRYELIEFAVYCLAARGQRLVPLHAACLGLAGSGALLLGASGAGKSTLMLQSLAAGFQFVAEDSVLVRPQGLLATGLANYLHLRTDSRHLAQGTALGVRVSRSTIIRRRSGVRKYELDLRRKEFQLAGAPVPLRALVFLSSSAGASGRLLTGVPSQVARKRLHAGQRYAARQPGWDAFMKQAQRLPAFELRRGASPAAALAEVATLLQGLRTRGG